MTHPLKYYRVKDKDSRKKDVKEKDKEENKE
jgi:hypothetical protein